MIEWLKALKTKNIYLYFITINILFFIYLGYQFNVNNYPGMSPLFFYQDETSTYFQPLENLVQGKGYYWLQGTDRYGNNAFLPSTRRVPGFGLVFIPLRYFFDYSLTLNLIILIQWSLYLLSWMLVLSQLSKQFKFRNVFLFLAFSLVSVSTFDKTFNFIGLPESLSNSSILLAIFFLLRFLDTPHKYYIFGIGIFATWSVFLRPLTGLFFIPIAFIILASSKKFFFSLESFKKLVFLFSLLGLTIGIWTIRNFFKTNQFIPLEDKITYSQPSAYTPNSMQMRKVAKAMGEQIFHWIPESFGDYFYNKPKEEFAKKYAWNDSSVALLESWHFKYFQFQEMQNPTNEDSLDNHFANLTTTLINNYKRDNFFNYNLISRLESLISFFNKGTYSYLPLPALNEMNVFQKIVKATEVFLHYGLLMGVVFLFIFMPQSFRNYPILGILTIYLVLFSFLSAMYFNATEPRYSVSLYPVLLIINSILLYQLLEKLIDLKSSTSQSDKLIE